MWIILDPGQVPQYDGFSVMETVTFAVDLRSSRGQSILTWADNNIVQRSLHQVPKTASSSPCLVQTLIQSFAASIMQVSHICLHFHCSNFRFLQNCGSLESALHGSLHGYTNIDLIENENYTLPENLILHQQASYHQQEIPIFNERIENSVKKAQSGCRHQYLPGYAPEQAQPYLCQTLEHLNHELRDDNEDLRMEVAKLEKEFAEMGTKILDTNEITCKGQTLSVSGVWMIRGVFIQIEQLKAESKQLRNARIMADNDRVWLNREAEGLTADWQHQCVEDAA